MLHAHRVLDDTADCLGALNSNKAVAALAVILDQPEAAIRQALAPRGQLAQSGLLTLSRGSHEQLTGKLEMLSDQFSDFILSPDVEPLSLLRGSVAPSAAPTLNIDDFPHLGLDLQVLRQYLRVALRERKTGVNVLVYGPPGTGKTELARVLAADIECELFEVSAEDNDGDPIGGARRLRAYQAAQRFLAQREVLVLFDEVEDVFEVAEPRILWMQRGAKTNNTSNRKGWVNKALEANQAPTLWLTNSIQGLDPAYVRRFDLVIQVPIPPLSVRTRIVHKACGSLVDESTLRNLAECETLAPAVLTRAASVVEAVGSELAVAARPKALLRLVSHTLQAQGHAALAPNPMAGLPEGYDPQSVHADADLVELVEGIRHSESARMCLYGPPGTGKTAYARWLAQQLDRPLYVRRASDLLSKWLGDNEKNIAKAFREAEADGAVLLIDEVDSFLRSRLRAERSWETSLVNEMLTQMEAFNGVFIASTNLMDDLDEAALRRFDLKVKFGYLDAAQARALFSQACAVLGIDIPPTDDMARLSLPATLTPGDFAAVMRQHRFRPIATTMALAEALEAECAIKHAPKRAIGFK